MMCCPRPRPNHPRDVGGRFPAPKGARHVDALPLGIRRQSIGLEVSWVLSLGRTRRRDHAIEPVARCKKENLTASCMQSDLFYSFKDGEATVLSRTGVAAPAKSSIALFAY